MGPNANDGTQTPHDVIVENNDISNVGTSQGFSGSVVIGFAGSNLHTGIGWVTVQDNNITVSRGEAEAGTIHNTRAPTGSNVIRRNRITLTQEMALVTTQILVTTIALVQLMMLLNLMGKLLI